MNDFEIKLKMTTSFDYKQYSTFSWEHLELCRQYTTAQHMDVAWRLHPLAKLLIRTWWKASLMVVGVLLRHL